MKKHLILVVSLILFAGSLAIAEERTGLGFEYGGGYLLPLNDYEMRSVQSFALTMDLSENLSASIFRAEGQIRGENSYTGEDDGTSPSAQVEDMDFTVINTGDMSITGLRFKHALPMDLPLKAGLEIGTVRFSNGNHSFRSTGGSGTPAATGTPADDVNWGMAALDTLDGSYPVLGLLAEAELFSHSTETVTVSVGAGLAFRIVSIPERYALGFEEAEYADPNDIEEIDAVSSFNTLAVTVGLNIGF